MLMEPTPDTPSTNKWSLSMRDGLLLSLVTLVCTTLSQVAQLSFLNILLWLVKLIGSIWLLWFFMKRYAAAHPEETRTTGYGVMVCLFSSIVCAVFTYISFRFLFPETVEEAFAQVPQILSSTPGVTPEVEDAIARLQDSFPQLMCILTLIWNFLIGLVISAIIGASTARKDPFAGDKPQTEPEKDELA